MVSLFSQLLKEFGGSLVQNNPVNALMFCTEKLATPGWQACVSTRPSMCRSMVSHYTFQKYLIFLPAQQQLAWSRILASALK